MTGINLTALTCVLFENGIFKNIVIATPEQLATIKTIVFDSTESDELSALLATCGPGTGPTLALRIAQYFTSPHISET